MMYHVYWYTRHEGDSESSMSCGRRMWCQRWRIGFGQDFLAMSEACLGWCSFGNRCSCSIGGIRIRCVCMLMNLLCSIILVTFQFFIYFQSESYTEYILKNIPYTNIYMYIYTHIHILQSSRHVWEVNIELVVCQVTSSASSCAGVHEQLGRPNAWPTLCSSGRLSRRSWWNPCMDETHTVCRI